MNKADCFNLGYVAKLHGYKGEVSLFFDATNPEDYAQLSCVYIELDGILIPFFVKEITMKGKGFAKVKFEGVETEAEARKLLRKKLYLSLELLPELSGNNFYDHEIVDFTVIDENYGEIGTALQVIDHPSNPILQIQNHQYNKEILLPIKNDLVQKIDRKNKTLYVQSVPGLIELYLND